MESIELNAIERLKRDVKQAAVVLTQDEVRYLVDSYYQMQRNRIRSGNQTTALSKAGEPHAVLSWLHGQNEALEEQIKSALDMYTKSHVVGRWARSQKGIGPVICAGLLAHIDIHQAPTVGHIWSFAGLNPNQKWGKGEKRPWNAALKVLCWKAGESFVKVSGYEDAYYGQIYKARKAYETAKNEAGDYAEQAARSLTEKKYDPDTDAYKAYIQGRLPLARVHARSTRYAVKMFLSHLHTIWYRAEFGKEPPLPFAVAHLGHVHIVPPPPGGDSL